jgi:CubicO group peptidase (beta-lactamase class C family)
MNIPRRQFMHLAAGAAFLLASSARSVLAQPAPKPASVPAPSACERAAMANLANTFMQRYDVPAFSFAVGYAGAIVYQEAFGLADREKNEAATPMHLFRIASLTKTITSVAIFTLIEQGRIKLTDRVFGPGAITGTDYGQPPYNPGVDQITLEHLLTHTAGGWNNHTHDPMFAYPTMNQAQLIAEVLRNRPLDDPPGEHYAYSNFGYCMLGRVIEKITGQPYADYVRATVLKRCGISDMTIAGNTLAQRQSGEIKYYGDGDDPYSFNVTRMDSHGGWIARPADIVQFFMHVDGFADPPNILKPQTIQTMTTPSAVYAGYAKGWMVNKVNNWWHNGDLIGTIAEAVRANSGFCWAGIANKWHHPAAQTVGELDKLQWSMVQQVRSWRVS